jgi:redox-sensitive bicupin YhaK (pirin superfamily)
VAIWTINMEKNARFTLPAASRGAHRMLYFFRGSALQVNGQAIPPVHSIRLRSDAAVTLQAGPDEVVELLLLQGRPVGEPVVQYGPFVMNSRAEIQQAFADYQRTQFGGWPWPKDDPVHADREGRFAKHANGRIERAG